MYYFKNKPDEIMVIPQGWLPGRQQLHQNKHIQQNKKGGVIQEVWLRDEDGSISLIFKKTEGQSYRD